MDAADILVVDDDEDIREALVDVLRDEGYSVAAASSGREGLDKLATPPRPRLVLLDWNMAPMNGQAFLAELAQKPAVADEVRVAILTADPRAASKLDPGRAVAFLNKPIDLEQLLEVISRLVH
jgi:CheY-like chemotaxis protein